MTIQYNRVNVVKRSEVYGQSKVTPKRLRTKGLDFKRSSPFLFGAR